MNREGIGRCETCRYARYEAGNYEIPDDFWCVMWDDPKWEEMEDKYGDYMEMAGSETAQCPLWRPIGYEWCPKHRVWFIEDAPCPFCEKEAFMEKDISWQEANGIGDGDMNE